MVLPYFGEMFPYASSPAFLWNLEKIQNDIQIYPSTLSQKKRTQNTHLEITLTKTSTPITPQNQKTLKPIRYYRRLFMLY